MTATEEMDDALRRLRNAAPKAYEEFVKAFEKYSSEVTAKVIEAQVGNLQTIQGHAQQCKALRYIFEQIIARAA